jgi:hypothetical protein
MGYNDLNGDSDPRAAFLISNTFADGKFGALFSAAYTNRKLGDEGSSTVRWQAGGGYGPLDATYVGTPTLAEINAAYRPRIPRYDKYEHEQERIGLTAALQWAPSESTNVSLDAAVRRVRRQAQRAFLETPVFSTAGATGIGDVNVVDAVIDDTEHAGVRRIQRCRHPPEARHDGSTPSSRR